ncbi:MAG: nitric-oxide reductase large subunit [Acidobacteriota bacterium]
MRKYWVALALVVISSFGVLGWIGSRIYQEAPPIPERVVSNEGAVILTVADIVRGQGVWRAMGGMEVGSIWGHGSYVAPDWTALWLHREALFILNRWAQEEYGVEFDELGEEDKSRLEGRLRILLRENHYDPGTRELIIPAVRIEAFEHNLKYLERVFLAGEEAFAIPPGTISTADRVRDFAAFVFWTAWSSAAERPGTNISYTHNWPPEPLVGNQPTGEMVMWTGVSIILLLAGICAMVWWYAAQERPREYMHVPAVDPLLSWKPRPSQEAVMKYFWTVGGLILLQILMGVLTAHYGVEGGGFYDIALAQWLPYSITRTWHVQLGLFWIATSWLGAGLFIGPLVSGEEPRGQARLVNVLFVALLVIVLGSLIGQWMSVQHRFSTDTMSFYLGHQGYEYIDLGRIWQIGLFVGLLMWFWLVYRTLRPALRQRGEERQLLWLLIGSAGAIALFYGAGLMWGEHTHISLVEYWRWWVVHLWVEGFFELFATVAIAFVFTRLGLVTPVLAARTSLLAATIYLAGGIIGTCHHLYFSGTPTAALAFGAVFSALEVVPLTFIAYAAMEDYRRLGAASWVRRYRWPVYFFMAVAFWNMVGAGLFGFMINPPIALYYMQGLNTTPLHGHAALFGVYGLLSISLILVCLRASDPQAEWEEKSLRVAFWAMNVGLLLMCVASLLPVGLLQTWASVDQGYWYARSAEFLGRPLLQFLRWMRIPGDVIFAAGALIQVWFFWRYGWQRRVRGTT